MAVASVRTRPSSPSDASNSTIDARARHGGGGRISGDDRRGKSGHHQQVDDVFVVTQASAAAWFADTGLPLDERGIPPGVSGEGALQSVYFVGFDVRQPGGLLRTIAQQAELVAERISARQAQARGGVHGA